MSAEGRLELRIERLVAGGDGLARHGGRAVFVPLALPGESVAARIVEERRDFARAEVLELLEASPDRVEAPCPVYGLCGGCRLQHLEYGAQLRAKASIVADLFRKTAGLEVGELPIEASPPYGSRNRLQFHFDGEGRLGFMRRESREVVAVPTCPIAVEAVRLWLEERALSPAAREELAEFVGDRDRFLVFGAGERVWVEGRHETVKVRIGGEDFGFPLGGFFQSNLALLERLVSEVVEGCAGGRAADLYAGVGLFGRFLAKRGARVTMVEENATSLAAARGNAPGPANEWYAAAVETWCRGSGRSADFDFVVVDPPRSGLSPTLRAWLAARKPPLLSYVSCDPVTLARDSAELLGAGFRLDSLKLFDFYPQTGHVEALARFVVDEGDR